MKNKKKKKLPERNVHLCPFNGHQASWCRGFCTPVKGIGTCGREAPHIMRSRIQKAMAAHNRRQKKTDQH